MKACKICGVEKPLIDFYKHSGMKDGHLNKCKDCTKSESIANRNSKIEYYRAYDKERDTPERQYNRGNARRADNPLKYRARYLTSNAIRDGRLLRRPCAKCGSVENIEAHHEDYTKPLEVVWLCKQHHQEIHDR